MILDGVEVNRDNIHDWSIPRLEGFKKLLGENIHWSKGDLHEELLLIKLIDIEIGRQEVVCEANKEAQILKDALISKAGPEV